MVLKNVLIMAMIRDLYNAINLVKAFPALENSVELSVSPLFGVRMVLENRARREKPLGQGKHKGLDRVHELTNLDGRERRLPSGPQ